MRAEIICVGTELLLGDILNTNVQFLSQELANLGISMHYQTVVGDNPERVKDALAIAFDRADLVITSGGLGPTKDDLTKETIAGHFGKKLILDEEALKQLTDKLIAFGLTEISESNKKQAYLPEGCIPLYNDNGTAPGCIIEEGNKIGIMLPGPPKELVPLFLKCKEQYLLKKTNNIFVSQSVKVFGMGEAEAADRLSDLLDQANPTVAPYAKEFGVTFRVTAAGENEDKCRELIAPIIPEIRETLGDVVYSVNDDEMEDVVYQLLKDKGLTISTAESCTGGLLASTIINVPGASDVFKEGVTTYSNESKVKLLGVKEEMLEKYTAYSEEVAKEMVENIARISGTNIAVSTTGVVSIPNSLIPTGEVYIGLFVNGQVSVGKYSFVGNRNDVRRKAVVMALDLVRRAILNLN